jgi:hypothetical protein
MDRIFFGASTSLRFELPIRALYILILRDKQLFLIWFSLRLYPNYKSKFKNLLSVRHNYVGKKMNK